MNYPVSFIEKMLNIRLHESKGLGAPYTYNQVRGFLNDNKVVVMVLRNSTDNSRYAIICVDANNVGGKITYQILDPLDRGTDHRIRNIECDGNGSNLRYTNSIHKKELQWVGSVVTVSKVTGDVYNLEYDANGTLKNSQ